MPKLMPKDAPGRVSRKAKNYAVEIHRLQALGYSLRAIHQALADAGVYVSVSTVQREAARPVQRPPAESSFPLTIDNTTGRQANEKYRSGADQPPVSEARQGHQTDANPAQQSLDECLHQMFVTPDGTRTSLAGTAGIGIDHDTLYDDLNALSRLQAGRQREGPKRRMSPSFGRHNLCKRSMNIALPEGLKTFVDEQVAARGYSSCGEYVRELIRRDQDRVRLRSAQLSAM